MKLKRSNSKVLGGVCSGLGENLNISPLLIRVICVITGLMFTLPIFIYLVLWIATPEVTPQSKEERKRKHKLQLVGLFTGTIAGVIAGFLLGAISVGNDPSGGIISVLFAIMIAPFGAVIGFGYGRVKGERRTINFKQSGMISI